MSGPVTGRTARPSGPAAITGSDELAHLLLKSTGEGIYGIDLEGNCTFANPACLRLLGYDRDTDLLDRNMHRLVHHTRTNGEPYPEKQCRIYSAFRQRSGTHVDDEVMFRADGTPFPVEYWSYPVDRGGELVGCVVTFMDITERRAAEERLARQSRQLAELARFPEMNPGPVCRLDRRGNIVLANRAARDLFGDDDLVGKCWQDICPRMSGSLWRQVLAADRLVRHEAQMGERYYVFAHTPGSDGSEIFVYGADLTELRQAERALGQAEKMATLGTLAAGVAHELNNPAAAAQRAAQQLTEAFTDLQAVQLRLDQLAFASDEREILAGFDALVRERAGCACDLTAVARSDRESALEEWLATHGVEDGWELAPALVNLGYEPASLADAVGGVQATHIPAVITWLSRLYPVYSLLEEIRHAAGRLSEIVGALKAYSYVGQAPVQTINVNQGIRNTLIILRNKLKQGVEVTIDLADDLPPIQAYGGELNQVWTNLIDNSVSAMGGHGRLTVRTRRDNGWIAVEIEDDGPGIPEAIQPRVFDAFFTTKAPGEGTGLGLHTSYNVVVNKHGGRMDVSSRPGCTRFTVKLPVAGPATSSADPEERP